MSSNTDFSERTISFVTQWNERNESYPMFELDGSWPSLGTIGLLSSILVRKIDLTNEELDLIDIISWYLGSVVKLTWNEAGIVSEIDYGADGVEVIGKIPTISDAPFRVKLSLVVKVLLQRVPSPLPVLISYHRELPVGADLFSPVMLGILLCQSPLLEGIEEDADQSPYLAFSEKIIKLLSKSTAQFYERCFPDEPLGQMAEIYLAGQIYPPLGMNETWPCINSTSEIIKSLKELGASAKAILRFAENLLIFPSEHLSFTGLVLAAAIGKEPFSRKSLAHFEVAANYLGFLRPALVTAKKLLAVETNWVKSEIPSEKDLASFEIEKKLGFLPWINMKSQILKERPKEIRISKLLKSLTGFDMSGSVGAADSIIDKDPSNLEVRFQRIKLHLLAGELQQAEYAIRLLATEPEGESDPRLYLLWAKVDLAVENPGEALRHIGIGLSYLNSTNNEDQILLQDVIAGLIYAGGANEALALMDSLPSSAQLSYSFLLNKFRSLVLLERHAESSDLLKKLVELCPTHPETFFSAFLR